jgi:hypothetical protein
MLRRLMNMRFLAADEAATGGQAQEPNTEAATPETKQEVQPTAAAPETQAATFTQADIDRIVKDRLDRERKAAAEERKRAEMTEADKLKAEKADLEAKVTEAETRAAARMVQAEARLQSIAVGVKPDRIDALLKLADLSTVSTGDNGEPDAKQIKAAIESALKAYPEFKVGPAAKGGTDYSAGGGEQPLTEAAIMAMTPAELASNMQRVTAFYAAKKAGNT